MIMKPLKAMSNFLQSLRDASWQERITKEDEASQIDKATRCHSIPCKGDVCVGDQLVFVDRIWERQRINSYGKMANVITDYQLVEAEVIRDSYGAAKQQHTFTLKLADKTERLIKGRNLYAIGCWRRVWDDETQRNGALDEKHVRGKRARVERTHRKLDQWGFA